MTTMYPDQNQWPNTPATGTRPASAPGWYPDPSGAPQQRWWDGTQWTAGTSAGHPTPGAAAAKPASRSWVKWAALGAALLALVALLVVWGNRPAREGQPGERATVSMPELQTGPAQDAKFLEALDQEGVDYTSRIQAQDGGMAYCISMIEGNGFMASVQRIMDLDMSLDPTEAVKVSEAAEQAYCPHASLAEQPR